MIFWTWYAMVIAMIYNRGKCDDKGEGEGEDDVVGGGWLKGGLKVGNMHNFNGCSDQKFI